MNSFSIQAKVIDPQTKETIPTKQSQTKEWTQKNPNDKVNEKNPKAIST